MPKDLISILSGSQKEKRKNDADKIFEEIMIKNFTIGTTNIYNQRDPRCTLKPKGINSKESHAQIHHGACC